MLGTQACLQMLLLSSLSLLVYKSFYSFCPRVDVVITAEHDRPLLMTHGETVHLLDFCACEHFISLRLFLITML